MLGNVAFCGNTKGGPGFDIYPKLFAKLQCCHVRPAMIALDEYRRRKTRKCIAIAIVIAVAFALCHLENTLVHKQEKRA